MIIIKESFNYYQKYLMQHFTDNNQKYQIIYLNGPSSSGKSTLARALQNKLKNPFLLFGIDQMISMMPEKMNDWYNETNALGFSWQAVQENPTTIDYTLKIGPYGKHIIKTLKKVILSLAKSGNKIIIDDVSFGKQDVDTWMTILKDFNVLWIGITSPIKILEEREKTRGDRKIGSAKWQAQHVHKNVVYDLMIDTYTQSIENNIKIIMNKFQ